MTRAMYAVLSVVLVFGVGAPLSAHHSFAAHYDMTKAITVQGAIVEVRLTNPHSWFFLDVKEADGKLDAMVVRSRHAERHDSQRLQGERAPAWHDVTITRLPGARQSQNVGMLQQLTTADGKTYGMFGPQEGPGAR